MIPCDSWPCPACGPAKRARLVGHYAAELADAPALHLVTLTLDPSSGVTPEESRRYIVHLLSLWRKRLHRSAQRAGHANGIRYVATVEWQRATGLAHIHAVVDLPGIDADSAASAWSTIGGGIVCDVQPVAALRPDAGVESGPRGGTARAIGYVLKYALKEAVNNKAPGRRYVLASASLGYYSKTATSKRRAFVEDRLGHPLPLPGEPRATDTPGIVEVLMPSLRAAPGYAPDTVTPADRLRFAELRSSARRTTYRYLCSRSGLWYRITQDGPTRTREHIRPPPRWRAPSAASALIHP